MLDSGGICISCFQVHSILETGFRMDLVEHCMFGPVIPVRYVAGVLSEDTKILNFRVVNNNILNPK